MPWSPTHPRETPPPQVCPSLKAASDWPSKVPFHPDSTHSAFFVECLQLTPLAATGPNHPNTRVKAARQSPVAQNPLKSFKQPGQACTSPQHPQQRFLQTSLCSCPLPLGYTMWPRVWGVVCPLLRGTVSAQLLTMATIPLLYWLPCTCMCPECTVLTDALVWFS